MITIKGKPQEIKEKIKFILFALGKKTPASHIQEMVERSWED